MKISLDKTQEKFKLNYEIKENNNNIINKYTIDEIIETGLFNISVDHINTCEILSIFAHGSGFANIERILRCMFGEFNKYINSKIDFSLQKLYHSCIELYNICNMIRIDKENKLIICEFKNKYKKILQLILIGLRTNRFKDKRS